LRNIVDLALQLATKAGVECDVYGESRRMLQIQVHGGELESVDDAVDAGIGIRVVDGGRVGFSFTSDLEGQGVEACIDEASRNASNSSPMDADVLADPEKGEPPGEAYPAYPQDGGTEAKVEKAIEMERACLKFDSSVVNTEDAVYSEYTGDVVVAGTRGFFRGERRGYCCCSVSAIARRGDETRSGWFYSQALHPKDIDFAGTGHRAAVLAVSLLGGEKARTKRYAVVVDGAAFTSIISFMERILSAEMVVKGTSVLSGMLGEMVSADGVTLIDDPFMAGGCFNACFDAEGMLTRKNTLIESGVLRGYLSDAYSSRKLGMHPGANAVRESFKARLAPGPTNLYLAPGIRSIDDIVADLDEGIIVRDIMGMHTSDPISGDFSVGFNGHTVRAGVVCGPVCEMTMSGNIIDLLGGIKEVAGDTTFIGPYGSPAVLVEGLSLGGT